MYRIIASISPLPFPLTPEVTHFLFLLCLPDGSFKECMWPCHNFKMEVSFYYHYAVSRYLSISWYPSKLWEMQENFRGVLPLNVVILPWWTHAHRSCTSNTSTRVHIQEGVYRLRAGSLDFAYPEGSRKVHSTRWRYVYLRLKENYEPNPKGRQVQGQRKNSESISLASGKESREGSIDARILTDARWRQVLNVWLEVWVWFCLKMMACPWHPTSRWYRVSVRTEGRFPRRDVLGAEREMETFRNRGENYTLGREEKEMVWQK